jgi:hypothetical protein
MVDGLDDGALVMIAAIPRSRASRLVLVADPTVWHGRRVVPPFVRGETVVQQALDPVQGERVWRGPELAPRSDEWAYRLDAAAVAELDAAVADVENRGLDILDIQRDDFVLPTLGSLLQRIQDDLQNGRGFALLRGIRVERYAIRQAAIAFFGIGAHLGEAVSQNARGHALGHVYDLGFDPSLPTARGYQSARKLNFHTDPTDVVALMCLRKARAGGLSRIVSSGAVFNAMLAVRPDLVKTLTQTIYRDRRGEIPQGCKPWYCLPVFNFRNGRLLTNYVRSTIDKAQRFEEVPRLTDRQLEAFALIEAMAADPALYLDMDFEPGDIQFLNNHLIMHSRSDYEDFPEPERRRHLLRLWLACDAGPPLPDQYFEFMGKTASGRPNGYQLGDVPLTAPLTPEDGGPGESRQRVPAPG